MNRKQAAESLRGRQEVRRVAAHGLEVRDANGAPVFSGYASVTDTPYRVGYFEETIKRGAFTKTLSESPDVVLLVGHTGLPLARTLSNTLQLTEDSHGLRADATLDADDPDVQALLPKVRRGDLTEMSFAFRVIRDSWDDSYEHRAVLELSLDRGDVSIVTMGASPTTSFSIRDAKEFLAELSRPEFDDLVRSLDTDATRKPRDLDFYRARAFALRLKAGAP